MSSWLKNAMLIGALIVLLSVAATTNVTGRDRVSHDVRSVVNILLILMFSVLAWFIIRGTPSWDIRKIPGFKHGMHDVAEFLTYVSLWMVELALVGYLGNLLAESIWQWIGGSTVQDTYTIVRGALACILVSLVIGYVLWDKSCAATVIAGFVAALAASVWFAALGPVNVLRGIWNGYLTFGIALQVGISVGTMLVGTCVALIRSGEPLYRRFFSR